MVFVCLNTVSEIGILYGYGCFDEGDEDSWNYDLYQVNIVFLLFMGHYVMNFSYSNVSISSQHRSGSYAVVLV